MTNIEKFCFNFETSAYHQTFSLQHVWVTMHVYKLNSLFINFNLVRNSMPTSTHYTKVFPSYVNRIRIYFQRTVEVCHYIGLQRRGRTAVICDRCMRPTFPSGACCFTATVCHHYSFLCPFIHFTFFDWQEELSSLRMTSTVMAMRLQSAVVI